MPNLVCTICDASFVSDDGRRKRCGACVNDHAAWARKDRKENSKNVGREVTVLRCASCKEMLPTSKFFRNRATRTGFHSRCKTCFSSDSEKVHFNKLWTGYRLRREDIEFMLSSQGGGCAICSEPLTAGYGTDAKVDHDHSCDHPERGYYSCKNCVRGLLCHSCNVWIGYLEKRLDVLDVSLSYLDWNSVRPGTIIRVPNA